MFETEIYPILVKIIFAVISCPDIRNHALSLAWYYWMLDKGRNKAKHYARYAIRHALAGRDLPGVKEYTDIFDRQHNEGEMGLGNVHYGQRPLDILVEEEEWDRLMRKLHLSPKEWTIVSMTMDGCGPREIGAMVGESQGGVRWARQQVIQRLLADSPLDR